MAGPPAAIGLRKPAPVALPTPASVPNALPAAPPARHRVPESFAPTAARAAVALPTWSKASQAVARSKFSASRVSASIPGVARACRNNPCAKSGNPARSASRPADAAHSAVTAAAPASGLARGNGTGPATAVPAAASMPAGIVCPVATDHSPKAKNPAAMFARRNIPQPPRTV